MYKASLSHTRFIVVNCELFIPTSLWNLTHLTSFELIDVQSCSAVLVVQQQQPPLEFGILALEDCKRTEFVVESFILHFLE